MSCLYLCALFINEACRLSKDRKVGDIIPESPQSQSLSQRFPAVWGESMKEGLQLLHDKLLITETPMWPVQISDSQKKICLQYYNTQTRPLSFETWIFYIFEVLRHWTAAVQATRLLKSDGESVQQSQKSPCWGSSPVLTTRFMFPITLSCFYNLS